VGELLRRAGPSLVAVAVALVGCFLAIAAVRGDLGVAADAYAQMLFGGLGDWPRFLETGRWPLLTRPWGEASAKAALLTLTGLSVAVAFKAGLFNIGAQGQMIVGAITAAVVGAHLPLPAGAHAVFALLGAAFAGALYALLPALLKVRRGVHEVISTIMLNWVAVSLVENWLVVGPLRAASVGTTSRSGTEEILDTAQLPRLLGDISRLNAGFLVALFAVAAVWLWLSRSTGGYETRVAGLGPEAGQLAGISVAGRTYRAMMIAGALAGLAGAVLVLGTEHKFPATLGAPYGFDGIAIALIGQNHPVGVLVSGLFFGALRAGGTRMQLLGVHKSFPELIQGVTLLLVAASVVWTQLAARRRQKKAAPGEEVARA
jgi:general nucleoside transport system permease protein